MTKKYKYQPPKVTEINESLRVEEGFKEVILKQFVPRRVIGYTAPVPDENYVKQNHAHPRE